ncbi:transcriptional regulator, MarR family [Rhizorhabdus wittichii RW1]|uniref:Transcriptional regulator, MarR family n=1 Tax=Rhizorhabdus wittichii (strain DSM 6014 / CCUG 31198 / JCM 15750 / NBRC 105917 / EY 4224 / RW1) TaxID=392499 RepID=A0A9J9LG33_RHIWR|nr:transcriptional regulator, MarR family [Rhizorhabdus wittichii RW1]
MLDDAGRRRIGSRRPAAKGAARRAGASGEPVPVLAKTGELAATLRRQVGFQLGRAMGASFQAFSVLVDDKGLRAGHYAVLQVISDHPGISQTQLSLAVGRDKTTLTPLLKEMERGGLIARHDHPTDRRSRLLDLTALGRKKLSILAACAARHERQLDAILGDGERAALLALLNKVADGLTLAGDDGDEATDEA